MLIFQAHIHLYLLDYFSREIGQITSLEKPPNLLFCYSVTACVRKAEQLILYLYLPAFIIVSTLVWFYIITNSCISTVTVGFLYFSSYLLCFNPSQFYYAEVVPSLPGGWLLSLFDIIPVVLLVFAYCLAQQDVLGSSFT